MDTVPSLPDLLFLGLATNLLLSCLLTVAATNAVNGLVALIFAFINGAGLFLLMELEFVGLLFLIVYVGAVSVLFLFSVMLFHLKEVVRTKATARLLKGVALLLLVALAFSLAVSLWALPSAAAAFGHSLPVDPLEAAAVGPSLSPQLASDVYYLGQVLYGRYGLQLLMVALVLLVAMMAAVVLISSPRPGTQMQLQHNLKQMSRGFRIGHHR